MTSPLRDVLGADFMQLPPIIREFHGAEPSVGFVSTVSVRYGNAVLQILSRWVGFPGSMRNAAMQMSIAAQSDHEEWQRDFGGHILVSRLRALPDGRHVAERFGPVEVRMRPEVAQGGLDMPVVGLRVFGLPVPSAFIGPSGGTERVTREGALAFEVTARAPLIGLVISYAGTLAPARAQASNAETQ
ncbi:MAG: DUF4166 domain-containing protein [Pseudomonadota bacterium]